MNERTPENIRFCARVVVSKYEQDNDPKWTEHLCRRRLHEELAATLVATKVEKIARPEYFEHSLELYIATADEFWEIVNRRAQEIAMRFGRTLDVRE